MDGLNGMATMYPPLYVTYLFYIFNVLLKQVLRRIWK